MEPHLLKEEIVLFPLVRELAGATAAPSFHCGSVGNPIRVMTAEHDSVGHLLHELRVHTGGYMVPEDGCASYRALYEGLAELEADNPPPRPQREQHLVPGGSGGRAGAGRLRLLIRAGPPRSEIEELGERRLQVGHLGHQVRRAVGIEPEDPVGPGRNPILRCAVGVVVGQSLEVHLRPGPPMRPVDPPGSGRRWLPRPRAAP